MSCAPYSKPRSGVLHARRERLFVLSGDLWPKLLPHFHRLVPKRRWRRSIPKTPHHFRTRQRWHETLLHHYCPMRPLSHRRHRHCRRRYHHRRCRRRYRRRCLRRLMRVPGSVLSMQVRYRQPKHPDRGAEALHACLCLVCLSCSNVVSLYSTWWSNPSSANLPKDLQIS